MEDRLANRTTAKRYVWLAALVALLMASGASYGIASIVPRLACSITIPFFPMVIPCNFDQREWLAEVENEPLCKRGRMAGDVIDSLGRMQSNREAVLALLGKGWAGKGEHVNCERYDLGLCAGPKIVVLNVCFDGQDRFSRAHVSYH